MREEVNSSALGEATKRAVVTYCLRLLDQMAMPASAARLQGVGLTDPRLQDDATEALTLEVIRLLDLLCQYDQKLVTELFPVVKRFAIDKFHGHIRRTQSRHSGVVFLGVLQLFVNHSERVIFDVEPVFKSFFHSYLSHHYGNSILAYETIMFCIRNKHKLLTHTSLFAIYFPAILKLFAWHPQSFRHEFLELLPALVSPLSHKELLHSLLDLPLLAAVMEASVRAGESGGKGPPVVNAEACPEDNAAYKDNPNVEASAGGRVSGKRGTTGRDPDLRRLSLFLLREESVTFPGGSDGSGGDGARPGSSNSARPGGHGGATIDLSHYDTDPAASSANTARRHEEAGLSGSSWGAPRARAAASRFCRQAAVTARVHEVCVLTPMLLDAFFTVMLTDAPAECLSDSLHVVFQRFGLLFGSEGYQGRIRRVLLDRCLAAFHKYPYFLMSLKGVVLDVISDPGGTGLDELGLHVCWVVGEYANKEQLPTIVLHDLYVLERRRELSREGECNER